MMAAVMPDQRPNAGLAEFRDQAGGGSRRIGDRLFDQDMDAGRAHAMPFSAWSWLGDAMITASGRASSSSFR